MKAAGALTLTLIAATAAQARDRGPETCASYERATGTVVTECQSPERKPTHCESVHHATGSVTTECR
jgi:hypothetical protein